MGKKNRAKYTTFDVREQNAGTEVYKNKKKTKWKGPWASANLERLFRAQTTFKAHRRASPTKEGLRMQILTVTHERAKPALHTSPPRVPLHCHLVFFCSFYSSLFSFLVLFSFSPHSSFFMLFRRKECPKGSRSGIPSFVARTTVMPFFPLPTLID